MSASGRVQLAVALAAFACVVPHTMRAQQSVAWTVCTPGSLNACASVQLSTTALFTGATRTGTDVAISIHNLNGQSANDNTFWSGLYEVDFTSTTTPVSTPVWSQAVTPTGVATGSATWQGYHASNVNDLYSQQVYAGSNMIGGCTDGTAIAGYYATGMKTCGANAAAVLSFNWTTSILDASTFDGMALFGFASPASGYPASNVYCASNFPLDGLPQCNVLSETTSVTPEPVTMALMATGLFGIGGVGLRRKKRSVEDGRR